MNESAKPPSLSLQSLSEGMPGMERALGESCAHAAGVCLEHERHTPDNTVLTVDGSRNAMYSLTWDPTTDRMRRSWQDLQEATEWGAAGLSAILVRDLTGYEILERSCKGSGFDYWVGDSNAEGSLFQNKARLEVTGILHGSESEISTRLHQKTHRFSEHPHELPAMVVLVEFGMPRSRVSE